MCAVPEQVGEDEREGPTEAEQRLINLLSSKKRAVCYELHPRLLPV